MDVVRALDGLGGIGSVAQLRDAGVPGTDLAKAVELGLLIRVRRGWYATSRAPHPVRRAVAAGGRLTCLSALRIQGVWVLDDGIPHVALAAHGRCYRDDVVKHWVPDPGGGYPMDDVPMALRRLTSCGTLSSIVVAADSIINLRKAGEDEVLAVLAKSARGRSAARWVDGSAQSGLESLARLSLARRNIRLRPQAPIDGVGHVDVLIGDRLVLELDGEEWHGGPRYEEDRRRDLALVAAGYLVVRVSYKQVTGQWREIEQELLRLIRRRAHVRRAR